MTGTGSRTVDNKLLFLFVIQLSFFFIEIQWTRTYQKSGSFFLIVLMPALVASLLRRILNSYSYNTHLYLIFCVKNLLIYKWMLVVYCLPLSFNNIIVILPFINSCDFFYHSHFYSKFVSLFIFIFNAW